MSDSSTNPSSLTQDIHKWKSQYNQYSSEHNWSAALEVLSKILEQNPSAELYCKRAVVFIKLEMNKKAYADLQQAHALDKDHRKVNQLLKKFRSTKEISSAQTVVFSHSETQDTIKDATVVDKSFREDSSQTFLGVGSRLGDYEILAKIGSGGMGYVFKAQDLKLDRAVALKLLHSGDSEKQQQNILKEAKTTANLVHPNIVAIHDIGEEQGHYYFTMDFIDGAPLKELIGVYKRDQLLKILIKVAHAIDFANNAGVIHRDLKPANIMVTHEDVPKVMDFGLAKIGATQESVSQTGGQMGTPLYMAPEQVQGDKVGKYTDVYALGVILFEILTGQVPFNGETHYNIFFQILNSEVTFPKGKKIKEDLQQICRKSLAKNPKERYSCATDFARDLQLVLDNKPISIQVSKKKKTPYVVALCVLILLGVLFPFWTKSVQERKIRYCITGSFPHDQIIEPETILLNGKSVRSKKTFAAGEYELVIRQPGYFPIIKKIIIVPSTEVYALNEVLQAIPRRLHVTLQYDVLSPNNNSVITFVAKQKSKVLKHGDEITPGKYTLKIEQPGYKIQEKVIFVWPDQRPYRIKVKLKAKKRVLQVSCDPQVAFSMSIEDVVSKVRQEIKNGQGIRPGKYNLRVFHPQYKVYKERIDVVPAAEKIHIQAQLVPLKQGEKNEGIAAARAVSFYIFDKQTKKSVSVHRIQYEANGKPVSFYDRLPVGKIKIKVQFLEYETVRKIVDIVPGDGPLMITLPLTKLRKIQFTTPRSFKMIDDILYRYVMYQNNQRIEPHLYKYSKQGRKYNWQVHISSKVSRIKIYSGYFVAVYDWQRPKDIHFTSIDIPSLMQHLEDLRSKTSGISWLESVERIISNYKERQYLRKCGVKNIRKLITYIEKLPVIPRYNVQKKEIVYILQELCKDN
ncbi:serine/threonine protein kinase [Candidatus Uabimicrobium amorphum]|uniref:Protein kinase n=1 Tax=Uabimicrobium amorphum TaxID=2596890 RepID=A0A5S9IPN6_UABAM|nr:serine/threonine-protein kinase [Candidatus Uabimicrobium amorphum]BBM85390.1 protein kinase [Candidatus Uabimicrobium amorphum]